ncbi:MAG TPA: response regulator transcription factor [Acidimicrobiia bacterium]|nr:response regulator transcription factor [Acidimicrobiia bacterium]
MTIRVLVADDEALVRSGIRLIVESQPDLEVVGEASDGAQAALLARDLKPHVVLMDVQMPLVDGVEATRRILRSMTPDVRVLMLTTFDRDEYLYEAMKAGASGFLLKSTPPEQLVNAIRVVATGDTLLAPAITRRLIEDFVQRPPPGFRTPETLKTLTERETEVLHHIAEGLSNAEIAERLFLSEGTIKTHVNRILTKLGLRDRVQAIVLAYESGLIRPGDRPDPPTA